MYYKRTDFPFKCWRLKYNYIYTRTQTCNTSSRTYMVVYVYSLAAWLFSLHPVYPSFPSSAHHQTPPPPQTQSSLFVSWFWGLSSGPHNHRNLILLIRCYFVSSSDLVLAEEQLPCAFLKILVCNPPPRKILLHLSLHISYGDQQF